MFYSLRNRLRRARRDETGGTTVEFMIVMPLIVFWFAGSFTFFDAYSEWTRSVKATYTVADILSRQTEVDDDYIDDMNRIFSSIMGEDSNDTWLRVSSVEQTSEGLELQWSTATGIHDPLLEDEEIPAEVIPGLMNGESVVLVESNMTFVPFQSYIGITQKALTKKLAISPRFTSHLANTDQPSG